jgi:hypothetical protein
MCAAESQRKTVDGNWDLMEGEPPLDSQLISIFLNNAELTTFKGTVG